MTVPPPGFENAAPVGDDGQPLGYVMTPDGNKYWLSREVVAAFDQLIFIPSLRPRVVDPEALIASLQMVVAERGPPAHTDV